MPGGTALAHAVYFGNPLVADLLIVAGAPINTLAEAAGSGRLRHHPPIDTYEQQGRVWALRTAAVCERLDAIDQLLDSGLAVDSEVEGATALHWAAFFGKLAAVQHLVSRDADPQGRDATHDGTPVDWCRYRRGELFRASPGHMHRLLNGEIPPGGKCDIKTLAREAAVDRAAFYGTRPYAHLREEFETRLQARQQAGDLPDRRDAQIARLKDEITTLRQRLADRDHTITSLRDFKDRALAQLASQHDEINRLRSQNERAAKVRLLPARTCVTGHATDLP